MHADEYILSVHQRLVSEYPAVPDAIALMDESAHDFGVAHFIGVDAEMYLREGFAYYGQTLDGIAVLTFDAGRTPAEWVVCHELGHGMHANLGGNPHRASPSDPVLQAYWAAMGYTTPLADAIAFAESQPYESGHKYYPTEHFADAFAWVTANTFGSADYYRYGGSLTDAKRSELRAFFASLRVQTEEDDMFTDEDRKKLDYVFAAMTGAEPPTRPSMIREVFDALKAGFNVTLPTFLDRLASGDKKVITAERE